MDGADTAGLVYCMVLRGIVWYCIVLLYFDDGAEFDLPSVLGNAETAL